MLSLYCRFYLDCLKINPQVSARWFAMIFGLFLSVPSTGFACNDSPVFAFSQALYLGHYARAGETIKRVEQERSAELAAFLSHVLAWKRAFDKDDTAAQKKARQQIDLLIDSLQATAKTSPTLEHKLIAGNVMIHAARIHLLAGEVFSAASLAKQGNALIQDVLNQAPQNGDAYLAAGLYQSYAGSDDPLLAWFKKIVPLKGDTQRGRELIELAAQRSPDYAFEAIRSLLMDLSWDRPEVCTYGPLFMSLSGAHQAPLDHQLIEIKLQLFCGQSTPANRQISSLNAQINLGVVEVSEAQQQWLNEANLYALAQAGSVKALESLATEYQANKEAIMLAYTQFSLAKAYDLAGQRNKALQLYKKVLASGVSKAYKRLAKTYIALGYQKAKLVSPDSRTLTAACTD